MLGKKHKLSLLFCLVLISSGLLGEIAHDHSDEIHGAEHHEFEFHDDCLTCSIDQTISNVEFISYHLFFSNHKEFDQIKSVEENKTSFFLSRAPPK
tara:strand:+ start:266 stop:553 length:288 start_codon:yes stop_codon:yes gene_type:complete